MAETEKSVRLSFNAADTQEATVSKRTSLNSMMPDFIAPDRDMATALQADSPGDKTERELRQTPPPTVWSQLNPLNRRLTPIPELSKVPDGGLVAWLQVLMGHLVCFNAWGYINSYGLFETYYLANIPHTNASNLAWVSSIQACLLSLVGAFSGFFHDTGYFYASVTTGLFLQLLGTFTTSASTQYWQIVLAQGLCQGLGNGLVFCPAFSVISTYFSRKRSVAVAIAASGGATGGVVFPVIAMQLMDKIGFGWTVRVMGFVQLFNSIFILLLARPRLPSKALRNVRILDFTVFKELPYTLFAVGCFLTLWSLYWAFTYQLGYLDASSQLSSPIDF
ncbi:MAG: hypothetical protein M1818_004775 [Claussenomyces sp. TS43310]|nr:MAG: hypothetical protein M1818_004775 [Claussenomyces sp. TS43310]